MNEFMQKLKDFVDGKVFPFTIIIRDPLGNSFISAPLGTFLPPELDKNLTLSDFERSWEEVKLSLFSSFADIFIISFHHCHSNINMYRTKSLD